MKTFTRIAAGLATAGLVAVGGSTAANAADANRIDLKLSDGSKATCYVAAQKPWIVGGVSRTASGSGTVYCVGGSVRVRLDVKLQKRAANGAWVNQNPSTYCVAYVGGAKKKCTEKNAASPGVWRTWVKGTVPGDSVVVVSGTTRFVPARHGITM